MDATRFDTLVRSFAAGSTRRAVLRATVAALGLRAGRRPAVARARKAKKRLKRNAFGCVNVGKPCRGKDKHCCSGVCRGKKPKKGDKDTSRCVAHGEGGCKPGQNLTGCGGQTVPCTTGAGGGACRPTTGRAGYCAGDGQCRQCRKDADCRPFCGPDAACVVCHSALCEFGTFCVGPIDDGCSFPPS